VGEEFDIIVEFDLPVYVTGTPFLYIETGSVDTTVEFSRKLDAYSLLFVYTVEAGQSTRNLTFADPDSVDALTLHRNRNALTNAFGTAAIYREASLATTFANLSVSNLYDNFGPLNFGYVSARRARATVSAR
jgi:hypothetical protein